MFTWAVDVEDLKAQITKHPESLHHIIRELNDQFEHIPDDIIDTLLDIPPDRAPESLSDSDLQLKYGLEQFTYEGTPYDFIRWFIQQVKPTKDDIIYDLGSGYGRIVLFGALTSEAQWRGIEIVPERVSQAQAVKEQFNIPNATFSEGSVLTHDFSDGTAFFLFNPFSNRTFDSVYRHLRRISRDKEIFIAAWGGGSMGQLTIAPWLKEIAVRHETPSLFAHKIKLYQSL